MSATVTTLTPTVGVEITGVSASELVDRQAADECQAALDGHGVVVYREVNIDDDDLLAFSRMLGTLVVQPTGEHKYPEIQTITLDPSKTNVMLAAYRQGNFLWHIDGLTDEVPQKGTLLTAREVDRGRRRHEFANTYAAYEALPEAEKAEIADLRVVHSFAHAQSLRQSGRDRRGACLLGSRAAQGASRWCGPTATAARRCCSAQPPRRWSAGLRTRAGRCWIACSRGQRNRSSPCVTSGVGEISSCGTTPACCTGLCRSSRPRCG